MEALSSDSAYSSSLCITPGCFPLAIFFFHEGGNVSKIRQYLQHSLSVVIVKEAWLAVWRPHRVMIHIIMHTAERVFSPLPRITGLHDWDGGWQGWTLHWIFHSPSHLPCWLLSKAVLFLVQLESTFTDGVCLQCWLVNYCSGFQNSEISVEVNKQKGMLCLEDKLFVLFVL